MEEIKVGDFIRTKQWGIVKVAEINEKGKCTHIKNKNNRITHYFEQLGRTSPNIIDLIEVGDYVNGCRVGVDWLKTELIINQYDEGWKSLKDIEIKSIVTHEQFNSIKYEVE
jgi:hypothetical protein